MSTPDDSFARVSLVVFPVQFLEITGDGRTFSPLYNIYTCLHAESKARLYLFFSKPAPESSFYDFSGQG